MSAATAVACYADRALHEQVTVVENVRMARDTYRIRLDCPEIARRIVPGQFVMLRLAGCDDPLLGRPLALYDTVLAGGGKPVGIDIVYLVTGKMTARLASYRRDQTLDIWGPLGNGFSPLPIEHLIMVAGGIGQTPFMAVGREYLGHRHYGTPARTLPKSKKVTLCYGARSADYLAGVDDFRAIGIDVRLSTDDGTAGRRGFVTEVLREVLQNAADEIATGRARILCCGPEKMMEAVAHLAHQAGVPCQVSLETPMACGIGICFSCVTKVRQPEGGWDYRRTCVEGPVFDAEQIVW
jgi:dihydroorotate dehydrogenase electron transfer subunit